MRADGGSKGRAKDQPFLMRTMSLYRFTAYRMDSRKGRANGPAHPYMHRRRRSGRSPALPYPPRRRAKLYHEVQQCGQYTLTFRKPFRVLFYLRQRYPFRVHFYVRQQATDFPFRFAPSCFAPLLLCSFAPLPFAPLREICLRPVLSRRAFLTHATPALRLRLIDSTVARWYRRET